MGKPTAFDQTTADSICERLADGESLRTICANDDMPSKAAVFRWLHAEPDFADQYARAREAQAEALADEIVDIADAAGADPQLGKLRVEARKWVASKLKPKRYGDRTLLGSDPENPLPVTPLIDATKLSAEALREIVAAAGAADQG